MTDINLQRIGQELGEGLNVEMFEKGYELTLDPESIVTIGGMNHPQGEWISPHVTVHMQDQETIEWFRERELLSYTEFYEGQSQVITESSFVIGSLLAAAQLRKAKQTGSVTSIY